MKAKRSLTHTATEHATAGRAGAHRKRSNRIVSVRAIRGIAVLALALGGFATTALALPQHGGAGHARVAAHQPAARHAPSSQLAMTHIVKRPWMY